MLLSPQDRELCQLLRDLPQKYDNRYTPAASRALLEGLFRSLANDDHDYLRLFFPEGTPVFQIEKWQLREAQGAVEGAEYTPAARGKPCGHIFKSGEATYRCKTCTTDDTCVLCTRCFEASDHTGHMVFVSISPGNSGCCDCGDAEAWVRPVNCAIHTSLPGTDTDMGVHETSTLPAELVESIKMTIGRALDYICDVVSCSPEQLRLPKTEENIILDEQRSRLTSKWYDYRDTETEEGSPVEYALIIWNDEKHTVDEVTNQLARACKKTRKFGVDKANETNDMGRSVVEYSTDLHHLLRVAKVIEEIKVTVTIRSSRDTFREQMCGTIVEWLGDIGGCSVGSDHSILRQTICEEMLKPWRTGSEATNAQIGRDGIDDHEKEEEDQIRRFSSLAHNARIVRVDIVDEDDDDEGNEDEDDENDENEDAEEEDDEDGEDEADYDEDDEMDIDQASAEGDDDGDVAMDAGEGPSNRPPIPPPPDHNRDRDRTPSESDGGEPLIPPNLFSKAGLEIPKTPSNPNKKSRPRPPRYWLEKPAGFANKEQVPAYEDLSQRLRLDFLILFDLRMWKKVRVDLRDLYITTVVTIPQFKRILGLRFAGLYTMLAQLYLIADREPDHSIINLSLQMLTTPSITEEVVERGNFLTNLLAILYTFLTTRQVGYPQEVNPNATLAFDAGSVTNRRMYHFFNDLRYLFGSEYVQKRLRTEKRYMQQFLDLVKLHQGICPNIRAVGEHVEYETDAWISATLITRELNRLCRLFADSFRLKDGDNSCVLQAITAAAKVTIHNSIGLERQRFDQSELQDETKFKQSVEYPADLDSQGRPTSYKVVDFVVDRQPISFHHALHYTLSWLIDCAKDASPEQLSQTLLAAARTVKPVQNPDLEPDDLLIAMFDLPLRVCAWLAQMKAGTWVRNGLSLRHQMSQYRQVSQRDVAYHRDLFLLQTSFITCNPSRILASMIDRFGLSKWMLGHYGLTPPFDDGQAVDIAEDFIHLLIILLSDRIPLLSQEDEPNPHTLIVMRDIAHSLCFKPLSFSELSAKLGDKSQDLEDFQDILDSMTVFRAPEGLADSGTFELKEEFLETIDPYAAHYSKNQREESENAYRKWMSKKTRKPASEIVFEPNLRPIKSGVFVNLSAFTATNLFAQIIHASLLYGVQAKLSTPAIPSTRVETFLQVVLHLMLIAVLEDRLSADGDMEEPSFINTVISHSIIRSSDPGVNVSRPYTLLALLNRLHSMDDYKTCHPKIRHIISKISEKRPQAFSSEIQPHDRSGTQSPVDPDVKAAELKKKQALERQARVMAQFQQQQKTFLENQGNIDWGIEDDSDELGEEIASTGQKAALWKYPSGTCILCQEETNDSRLYGTFGFIMQSNVLRQTNLADSDFVEEVLDTPASLDRSAEDFRPFGVSGKNRETIKKMTADGREITTERQGLGKGFSPAHVRWGPVSTGCGHNMHYQCFELYCAATQRRQHHQIARNHPERLSQKEFVCPLCKALGNAFLPIIWKGKEELPSSSLKAESGYEAFLNQKVGLSVSRLEKSAEGDKQPTTRYNDIFTSYAAKSMIGPLAAKLSQLGGVISPTPPTLPSPTTQPLPGFFPLDPLLTTTPTAAPPPPPSGEPMAMTELVAIYKRLRETIKVNQLPSRYAYPPTVAGSVEDLTYTDTLTKTLAFTVSSVEITQRGVESEPGNTLLDKIPLQTLTHLRIFSETVLSYLTVGGLRNVPLNKTLNEFSETRTRQLSQLFIGHPQISSSQPYSLEMKQLEPLLSQDIFVFLTESAACLVPTFNFDFHHIIRLCYTAEIVKVVLSVACEPRGWSNLVKLAQQGTTLPASMEQITETDLSAFKTFVQKILKQMSDDVNIGPRGSMPGEVETRPEVLGHLYNMVSTYALVFLRKSIILLHVFYGVEFPNTGYTNIDDSELKRLAMALNLPSLTDLFTTVANSSFLCQDQVIAGWIRHWNWTQEGKRGSPSIRQSLSLSHPVIFELVGLPKTFDVLTDETMRRRCPTTGKELTDPSICLFCGDIFCSQAYCCSKERKYGGCHQHLEKCGREIGIFINIRKCTVLYLHSNNGSWAMAPYLDKHGEVDPGLRRSRQLFLNQKRYDALLRNIWLTHGIPTTISRKLEAEINNGGWETI